MSRAEPALAGTAPKPKHPHGWKVLAVLSTLMGFASISTDVYLPGMPAMAHALGADTGTSEWTISSYLIGFALGQLLWGPIGDRMGRRLPVAIGLVLFCLGSIGCASAATIWQVIGWRMVQAAGASAGVVLGRAMVRDLYAGDRAAQMMSTLMIVMAIAPLLGPLVGGQLLTIGSWRIIFVFLVAVGLVTLLALATLPETLPVAARNREPLSKAVADYVRLLRGRKLWGYIGAGGFFYAGMFAYVAGTPFAYITYHHVAPQLYGLLFASGVVGIMGGNFANARAIARYGSDRLLTAGTLLAAISGLLVALAASFDVGGLWGLFVPLLLFTGATGFIVANAITGALALEPTMSGALSALIGATQYGAGIFGSALVGLLANGTAAPMGWVIGVTGVCAWLSTRLL
jgi:DHA1 family bicyclomycin/chloramphenicol resistance-like MFS transporter